MKICKQKNFFIIKVSLSWDDMKFLMNYKSSITKRVIKVKRDKLKREGDEPSRMDFLPYPNGEIGPK